MGPERLLRDPHREARQMPALGMEETKLRDTQILDVTVAIENTESIAALEHTCSVVRQRGGSAHVIFVCDADNIRQ